MNIWSKSFGLFRLCFIILLPSFSFSQNASPVENSGIAMTPLEKYIHAVTQKVVEDHKTTDKLSEKDLADLPIGIVRQIGNNQYVIAIDSAYWNGTGWYFSAYASIKFPGSSRPIAFAAKDVGFNKSGLASLSKTKLVLAALQRITLSDGIILELPADGTNSIVFDCNGFQSINLKGNFHFTSDRIIPVNSTDKDVVASFEVNATDISNLITTVNITPFKINGLNDVSFQVKKAAVDYSDYANLVNFSFPPGYNQPYGDSPTLWRGFYLEEIDVTINGISHNAKKPVSVQAKNLLIDDTGVSGSFTASNLLSLHEGSADGWPLSVTSLSVTLLKNSLEGGSMGGNLMIPFLGKDSLAYTAQLEQVEDHINYKFTVGIDGKKEYSAPFNAKVKLTQGIITIERKNGKLTPSASLTGSITVKEGKMETGLKFENLGLTTQSPYVTSGVFSTVGDSQSKSVGFPVRIDSVGLKIVNGQFDLSLAFGLNFMDSDDKGFSARTRVTISAKVEKDSTGNASEVREKWSYKGIKIKDIALNCSTTAFSLKGRLTVFDSDPTFGNGFHGVLNMSIKNVLDGVQVNGYFGRTEKDGKDGFRYWHLDAYVPMGPTGIPITPALSIKGIIGGASYKMARKNPAPPDFTKLGSDVKGTKPPVDTSKGSGIDFIPDSKASYSFLAGVTLVTTANATAFNSDAVLEVALNEHGGLSYVQFKGAAYFMISVESRGRSTGTEPVKAPLYAELNAMYDHANGTFHANMKAYLNLKNEVRGTGPDNMMGEVVIHFGQGDYYIWVGHPTQMLGMDIASLAVAQSYFMAGTNLENPPPLPPELRDIAGERDMSLVNDVNALVGGKGFALGAHFQVGYDSKDKLKPFHISLMIGAGMDVMIRDFGDATCEGSTGRIGFDGWYASGQAYVFMDGKVSVAGFDIVRLGAAALLQAKLPSPTWLKGQLAGRYSVMGGLIKGKFNLKLIIGQECEIVTPGTELGTILVISDITPGGTEVNVFSSPQVSFNTAIDTEFSMLNIKDETNSYRVKLDEFSVINTSNNQSIQANQEWNGKKDVLALRLIEILPPKVTLKAFVKLHWEKLENGRWQELLDNKTHAVSYETKETTFTTGEAPNFIPDENVAYSYPVKYQYNFLPRESGQGYVKLNIGQSYLFESSSDNVKWTYLAKFEQPSGNMLEVPVSYNSGQSTVNFTIPAELVKQSVYKLTFIKKPEATGTIDANVERKEVSVNGGAEGNEVSVASNTLKGNLTQRIDKEIYNSAFRTSQFATFSEKWNAIAVPQDFFDIAVGNIAVIGKGMTLTETFDNFELNGFANHHKPLIQLSASPESSWMANTMAPLLYNAYPIDPAITITHRSVDSLGVKPLRAVRLYNGQGNYILEDANISSGTAMAKSGEVRTLYYLSYIAFRDFKELRDKAALLLSRGNTSPGVTHLLRAVGYTDLTAGTYLVYFNYTLPGTGQVTSQKQIAIQF